MDTLLTRAKRSVLIWAFCILSAGSNQLGASALHLILVGDTATQDLSSSIDVDLKTIESHAREVCNYTGLSLDVVRFEGADARAEPVLNYVKGYQGSADDVVFFFFSGHGYRTPSKEGNPWPNIYFSTDQTGIDLQEIATILNATSVRLKLVIADCCNSSLPNYLAPPVAKKMKPKAVDALVVKNYKKLFLTSSGAILVASSKAGQPSWSINGGGSLYATSYANVFKTYVKKSKTALLDWQRVLDQAAYKTQQSAKKNGISQDPIYTTSF